MRYSYNLLKKLVDLRGVKPADLALTLDAKSFEVEGLEEVKHFGIKDTILLIETGKTNRVDALSHWGVAHELAAVVDRKLKKQLNPHLPVAAATPKTGTLKLKLHKYCRAYAAWRFAEVQVRESPAWLKSYLLGCAIKPINNVVDIANFVMLLTGQPLHAFDAALLQGQVLEVRRAKRGETLVALDGEVLKLALEDLVIADKRGPVALAGIKGGARTGITADSKDVVLEAANFEPLTVRRTSWRLGLRTDAARRFEKNLPPELIAAGLNEALALLADLAGAKAGTLSFRTFRKPEEPKSIFLQASSVDDLLGYRPSPTKSQRLLKRLGFIVRRKPKGYQVQVPFFRPDVCGPEDLIEEIGRLQGYEKIPEAAVPLPGGSLGARREPWLEFKDKFRPVFSGLGFDEVYNYSFYSRALARTSRLPLPSHWELVNPLSSDQELMRISLLPNLRQTALANSRFFEEVALVEFGQVYFRKNTPQFHDAPRIGLCLFRNSGDARELLLDLKGRLEAFFNHFHIQTQFTRARRWLDGEEYPAFSSPRGEFLGILKLEQIEKAICAMAELDTLALAAAIPQNLKFQDFSRQPAASLDLAIIVDAKISWAAIQRIVAAEKLVTQVRLFDVYQGSQIPKGQKSLALKIVFQDAHRTLSQQEINDKLKVITAKLEKQLGAKVR